MISTLSNKTKLFLLTTAITALLLASTANSVYADCGYVDATGKYPCPNVGVPY